MRIQAFDHPDKLPLYLKNGFVFFKGPLEGRMLVWAKIVNGENITPGTLHNTKNRLEQFFLMPVVFVFDRLENWQRKRLIEKQVAFVQTGKQLYIPELFLQLDDSRSNRPIEAAMVKRLSFPGQLLLLYHLQRSRLDWQPAFQIALELGYSAMTVSRVIRELKQLRLIEIRSGKEKAFDFDNTGGALWRQAVPFLRNPIKEVWYSDTVDGIRDTVYEAGETALADYSMLAAPKAKQFAIGKELFRSLRAKVNFPELHKADGQYRIEVWQYNPSTLAEPNGRVVDRLSLYLALRESPDERVTAAVEEAIEEMPW